MRATMHCGAMHSDSSVSLGGDLFHTGGIQHAGTTAKRIFVTIGALTERGGCVNRVTTKAEYQGKALARVSDIVTYDDGIEATIIDGTGFAAVWGDKSLAGNDLAGI